MILCHNIGRTKHANYNTIADIQSSSGPLSFDGVYRSVYVHMEALEHFKGNRRIILFVMGDYVGATNSFDKGLPPELRNERLCNWDELIELCQFTGAEMGWHSYGHHDLTQLSDAEVIQEITPPFYMKNFAYPYGAVDARVAELVRQAGYVEAWSVNQGDGSALQQNREYLCTKS